MIKHSLNNARMLSDRTKHLSSESVREGRKFLLYLPENKLTYGRMLSVFATVLQGKVGQPCFSLHNSLGDFVVVANLGSKIAINGSKEGRTWERYTGFHGGLKHDTLDRSSFHSTYSIVRRSLRGMLPKNHQLKHRLNRLICIEGEIETDKLPVISYFGAKFAVVNRSDLSGSCIRAGKVVK